MCTFEIRKYMYIYSVLIHTFINQDRAVSEWIPFGIKKT